jgi:hypothetical protein
MASVGEYQKAVMDYGYEHRVAVSIGLVVLLFVLEYVKQVRE